MPVIGSRGLAVLGLVTRAGRPLGPRQEEVAPASALHLISEAVPGSGRSRLVGATARGDGADDQPVQADGLVSGRLHRG